MSAIFGETLTFSQEKGPKVELVVFGDEFYARYETKEGYTAIYDENRGLYCYVNLVNGQCMSSGTPISKSPPPGTRRHLCESAKIRKIKFHKKFAQFRRPDLDGPAGAELTLGPENGLLSGRRVSEGDIKGLTILVEFKDLESSVTKDDVDALLNGENYSRNGNFSSVKDYFKLVSNNKLTYTNIVVGPIKLDHNLHYYKSNLFIREALDKAIDQFDIQLSDFDSKGDGVVDAINFMYAGRTVYEGMVWPHNSVEIMHYGDMRTHFYMLTSMGRNAVDLSIGTFCHESAHLLCRFPDMYDYGSRDGDNIDSSGIGRYCLMGSGNHLDNGRTPSPVSAYLRDLVGWASEEIPLNSPGQYEAIHGDYEKVMKFKTDNPNEYFIVENRFQKGLDEHLPSSGLAVYHCDILGSNELQEGSEDRHYQCALLQADGHLDLENDRNQGDDGDLYKKELGVALSHDTIPAARIWDGSDSGLTLSNITDPGSAIQFQIGRVVQGTIARGEVVADLIIPDDDSSGIESTINLEEAGKVKLLTVSIDISHTWISDLQIRLIAPSGENAMLHDKEGGSDDNIQKTYTTDSLAALQTLTGESIKGDWKLHIVDTAGQDTGRLNKWSIEVEYETESMIAEGSSSPALDIPDNNTQGVSSGITLQESGFTENITVEVEIAHTYIGDLMVELLSPSGHSAVLHNQEGFGEDNLKMTYDNFNTPSLQALLNQSVQGTWQLWIKDLAGADLGKLERWSLRIGYSESMNQTPPSSDAREKAKPQYATEAGSRRPRV